MNEVLAGLSVVSTICAIVFGYVAFARNGKRDVADEAKSDATVLTEIRLVLYTLEAWGEGGCLFCDQIDTS